MRLWLSGSGVEEEVLAACWFHSAFALKLVRPCRLKNNSQGFRSFINSSAAETLTHGGLKAATLSNVCLIAL